MTTEYFIEIIGDDPEYITSVLVGCIECGTRDKGLSVPDAQNWRANHHREHHTGAYTIDFTEDDPYKQKHRYKGSWSRESPVKDSIIVAIQDEWTSVPDIALQTGRSERSIRTALSIMNRSGSVQKKSIGMEGRKPQVRYMAA